MSLSRRSSPSETMSIPAVSWSLSAALIAMSWISPRWLRLIRLR